MPIKVTFNGKTHSKPGVYPVLKVQNLTGFPLQETGVVGIIGESIGGEPSVLDVLEGPQIQAAKDRYKSGAIADALGILVDPSKDVRVPNGASKIIVYKTNQGTKSSKYLQNSVPSNFVKLQSKNWGADENQLSVMLVAGTILDSLAKVLGTIDGPFVLAGGETLILKILGTTYTFTNTLTGSTTAAAMVIELNTAARWGGTKPVIATANGNKVDIELDPAIIATGLLEYGFIYVDATSTIDTILGITGSDRGTRGTRQIQFQKGTSLEDTLDEIGSDDVLTIKYVGAGTDCKLSIKDVAGDRKLTTVCTGASADNLDILLGATEDGELKSKMTVQELVNLINAHANYVCTTSFSNPSMNTTLIDYYDDLHIELVDATLKWSIEELVSLVTVQSELADAERISNIYGQLAVITTWEFFSGATDGSSANSNFSAGLDALKLIRANIIIPLISADKGTLSIETINALASSHATYCWSQDGRSPRNVYASYLGTKANLKAAAKALNSGYVSMLGQDPKVFSHSRQAISFLDPWAAACIVAGMQAGSPVGEPTTNKIINVNDLRVRDKSWNPLVDYSEMIGAGVTILEPLDGGGFVVTCGNTTNQVGSSFVYDRVSVTEAGGFVYYDLMYNLHLTFTGTKAKTGSAESIANFVKARMEIYLKEDIIVGDDDNEGLGYKKDTLRVKLEGNTCWIDVLITPVQGIDFILPTIYLANIRQSA